MTCHKIVYAREALKNCRLPVAKKVALARGTLHCSDEEVAFETSLHSLATAFSFPSSTSRWYIGKCKILAALG